MIGRVERVAEMIKRELVLILETEVDDAKLRDIAITRVEVTHDLRLAKVFYTAKAQNTAKARNEHEMALILEKFARFARSKFAEKLSMKFIPQILFRRDLDEERGEIIDSLFERIEKEHRNEQDGDINEQ